MHPQNVFQDAEHRFSDTRHNLTLRLPLKQRLPYKFLMPSMIRRP